MAWEVRFNPSALREFRALPAQVQVCVGRRLDSLTSDPRPPGVQKLEGGEGLYRVRLGDYRIAYAMDDSARVVFIVKVGHRGDVYRRRRSLSATLGYPPRPMPRALLVIARWIAAAHDRWRVATSRRRPLGARIDLLEETVQRLQEENELLRARLRRLDPCRRPRYGPFERLRILWH